MKRAKNEINPFIMLGERQRAAPLYRQIYAAIRASILSGELAPRARLPATRALAENLGVSRLTVVNAYEQLFAEGYLEGKTGAGTFVAAELPDNLLQTAKNAAVKQNEIARAKRAPLNLSPFGEKLLERNVENLCDGRAVRFQPFQNGLTAIDEFPFEVWARIAAKYYKNPPRSVLGYGDPQGYAPLREAIAAHLGSARGVRCTPEQIIITSGAQQALDLTARLFLAENDAALVEDPCYAEARRCFAATGARVVSVPVDGEGFDPSQIPQAGGGAKLVYATPSHQYPLGVTMTLARRLALLEWARANDALIVEDDYNSEYRYAGRPLASLQGLDRTNRVIYVGTFSKTVFPSLRIGCAVVPDELVDVFTNARALTDVHSPLVEQAILTEFIAEGHFARHVRRMRTLYAERKGILIEECETHLKGLLEIKKTDAGMHLVGWLPEGVSDREVSKKALEKNLRIAPVSAYSTGKMPRGGLVLGYTAFNESEIKNGVARLKTCLEEVL